MSLPVISRRILVFSHTAKSPRELTDTLNYWAAVNTEDTRIPEPAVTIERVIEELNTLVAANWMVKIGDSYKARIQIEIAEKE